MHQTCKYCNKGFEITPDDLAFLETVSPAFAEKIELIPPPQLCPDCRLQRRLAFRNQIHVYLRPDLKGKQIFSMYDPESPIPVMKNEEWWGGTWDGRTTGRPFDASRSLSAQMRELANEAPQYAQSAHQMQNSEYVNNVTNVKNCYFVFHNNDVEDCMYCEMVTNSKDCVDCLYTTSSELCYGCIWCTSCYNVQSSSFCEGCSDCFFLRFCTGCKHCFGCVNLRHQEYCVFNEQKTKEEYEAFLQSFEGTSWHDRTQLQKNFSEFALHYPVPHQIAKQTEDVTGNFLQESRGIENSFFTFNSEHLKNCFSLRLAKDCREYSTWGSHAELIYECVACGNNVQRLLFCNECWEGSSDCCYCLKCIRCHDCFGCIGLNGKQYCILNKQYTKTEYETLVPKIIDHMRTTGEWGEFFPINLSPMAYNHTIAQRYFPLTREQVEALGGRWYEDRIPEAEQAIEASMLPDGLPETDEPIIVKSELSGRPFKITSQEIKRYRQLRVPLPRRTYDERMEDRAKLLGGITLFDRTCAKTGKAIKTTISPDSPYIVWDREEWEREFGS